MEIVLNFPHIRYKVGYVAKLLRRAAPGAVNLCPALVRGSETNHFIHRQHACL